MNNSRLNSSNNSSGFMYYSLETPSNDQANSKTNSSEFLALGDHNPSPPTQRFNPTNFSSPYKANRGNQRYYNKRGWKHNRNQQHNNRSQHSNNSFNSSQNSSWNQSRDTTYYSNQSRNESFNQFSYLHPSFMEDPWAMLEKQHEAKKGQQNKTEKEKSASGSSNYDSCSSNEGISTENT